MVLPHPSGGERKQRQPEQQVQVGPHHCPRHRRSRVQHVMMIVPVDAHINETQDIAEERVGTSGTKSSRRSPCGTFISKTMIVMMIAITPSLNASKRPFVICPSRT